MMPDKDAVFVRHKIGVPNGNETLRKMWSDGVVVLDYDAIATAQPNLYPTKAAQGAMRRLNGYCEAGAIVGADFNMLHCNKMLVGEIERGSHINISSYDGYDFYKTVQLANVREISYLDYPVLLALQPRNQTICKWPSAAMALWAAFAGRPLPSSVYSLSEGQLEVLCYEYLRRKGIVESLLLPIGRTLRDIDIFGCTSAKRDVLAQVTFGNSGVEDKVQRLREHGPDVERYFFLPGRPDGMIQKYPDVQFVPIEVVFSFFNEDDYLIKRMLGAHTKHTT